MEFKSTFHAIQTKYNSTVSRIDVYANKTPWLSVNDFQFNSKSVIIS
jgi:hypothetical protein